MISANGTLNNGGASVPGCTTVFRSSRGVANNTSRSRERWVPVLTFHQFALKEERSGNQRFGGFRRRLGQVCQVVHATPLT